MGYRTAVSTPRRTSVQFLLQAKHPVKFNKAGEYHYFCALHPNEVGAVIVEKTKDKKRKIPRRVEGPVHVHFFFVDIVGLSDSEKGGTEN